MRAARLLAYMAAAALAIAAASCAHRLAPPAGYEWGLPVYPGAKMTGSSVAKESFAIYRTNDAIDDVDAWYRSQLPPSTPHNYDAAKRLSTFAIFDAHAQRSVHLQSDGSTTTITLTKLDTR